MSNAPNIWETMTEKEKEEFRELVKSIPEAKHPLMNPEDKKEKWRMKFVYTIGVLKSQWRFIKSNAKVITDSDLLIKELEQAIKILKESEE